MPTAVAQHPLRSPPLRSPVPPTGIPPKVRRFRGSGRPAMPEPVYTFIYRVATGAITFAFIALFALIVGAITAWKSNGWFIVAEGIFSAVVILFAEGMRAAVYDRHIRESSARGAIAEIVPSDHPTPTEDHSNVAASPQIDSQAHPDPPIALSRSALRTKRVVDVALALLAMLFLLPIMSVIAIALKLDSPGPVLFAQNRAGMGGQRFRMLKFRTMHYRADGEKEQLGHLQPGDPRLFTIPYDPRVTRLGHFLQHWSLDELPQLWNVLAGEMSFVGPRPYGMRTYEDHHLHRLGARPGITGLSQVSRRSTIVDFEEVVRLDREYIESWSLGLDLWVLYRTIPTLLRRTGAR